MAKPRIIIADTDVNYIIPLQLKFVEDFFEKVDLELITDETYFEELFSTPQQVDILIISEDLYTQSLLRHNITHVFLMTENQEEDLTSALNVNCIFKYTSIKEIFNEIIGKSEELFAEDIVANKESQIIVITSASGGVGKTTIAMGICGALAKHYKKVLYINSAQIQTFQYLLKNNTPITNIDVYSSLLRNSNENIYAELKYFIRQENFHYIPPFRAAIMSVGLTMDVYKNLAISAKKSGDYDYIVVDTDSEYGETKAELLNIADKVIFVTKQNRMAVLSTNLLVNNINGITNEKYICICNDFDKNKENALISPEYTLKYTVNEYIEHLPHYDQLKCIDFISYSGFQKLAYLFL